LIKKSRTDSPGMKMAKYERVAESKKEEDQNENSGNSKNSQEYGN
jgi:hypothetical protein